ncbi:MAG: PEP-CTERM sorting domain-containing protein [Rhodocyclaceae bacterium]|nr:PEP-CTERM sorting domain-containing protein [Rhodocyclaceae bacterium]
MVRHLIMLAALVVAPPYASASLFTSTSPSGLDVGSVGASTVGGVVVDLWGTNGAHVVSQAAASSLYKGFSNNGVPVPYRGNPLTVGIQTGFAATVDLALGGSLQSMSVRFTLWDGDSANANFDLNDLRLLLNGYDAGNWSAVNAQQTDSFGQITGSALGTGNFSQGGFRNATLDTGWFHLTARDQLDSILASIARLGELIFEVLDRDATDNFFDFTQGIDVSLLDVGRPPSLIPLTPVPAPGTLALVGLGLGAMLRRRMD